MNEQNKHRLARITERYAARKGSPQHPDRAAFDEAFRRAQTAVIEPVFEEVAAELRASGHAPEVLIDAEREAPSVTLRLGIQGVPHADPENDRIAFMVIARRPALEILAYLVVRPPPMDLLRFASADELTQDKVEQLVVDAVEHIFACRSTG